MTNPSTALRAETAERLHSIAIRLLRRARVADREAGVGPSQLSALSVLYFTPEMPLSALAEAEQVAQPTMTRIIRSLELAGAITRTPSASDRRVQLVSISPAGRRIFEAARARRLGIIEAILADLDDKSVTALRPLLTPLAEAIDRRR
jgi:DNA-binding MarR family transcriptional regulator